MKSQFDKELKTGIFIAKIALILFLIIFCFMLTGCDPTRYKFEREDLSEVVSVELINYENKEQKKFFFMMSDYYSSLKPYDNSKMSVVENLDKNKISDFIDNLCDIKYFRYYNYDSPKGMCLKLTYSDSGFLIIYSNYKKHTSTASYIAKFSPDGEVVEYFGSFIDVYDFKNLVNDYFQTQI